uniref:Uncharacterized protein n=1 Tax=Panagrolaimus davidi TaxID=227884 RepID=A0A914PCI6_9BILA
MEKTRQKLASLAPSPTLQQGFIPMGNYDCFNYQPQSPPVSLPQVSHQPMNLQPVNFQRSMHPSQYRQERPPPVKKQQSLRQQSSANDGAAAVPQPLTTHPQARRTAAFREEDFVRYAELRQANVYFFFKSGQQVLIIYDNLEVFLRQNAADNLILLRRHSKALTTLTEKAAWITFLKDTDDIDNRKLFQVVCKSTLTISIFLKIFVWE